MLGRHERIALALAGVHVTGEKKKKKKKKDFSSTKELGKAHQLLEYLIMFK